MHTLRRARCLTLLILALVFSTLTAWAEGPKVTKLEPPNWWVQMPHDPMLMLTGENLEGASVSVQYPGIKVTRTEPGSGGHYLFVWLHITPEARAGVARLNVTASGASTQADFALLARANKLEIARGLTRDDVVYLIMPDRFADGDAANNDPDCCKGFYDRAMPKAYHGGDLKGITGHMDYLKELGVTAIWLTPWWKNSSKAGDYHGYHVTDFYAVDDHLGSVKELQEMVAAAHQHGIKVVIDYVANHIGPLSPWANDPPTSTWLHGSVARHLDPSYDFWPLVDIHAPERDRRPVVEGWFAGKLPDINPDDARLEEFLSDNAIWWIETARLDALRLDTFPYSSRESWGKWHEVVRSVYPKITSMAEVWDLDPVVTSFYEGGRKELGVDTGTTSVLDFPLMDVIRGVLLHGKPASALPRVLAHDYLYQRPGDLVTFIGNHDLKRFMGEDGATLEKLIAADALLLTLRGIPQLYSGDEIAMHGGDDPDNRRDFPGGFAGDVRNAFTAAGRSLAEQKAFDSLKQLIALRKQHAALRHGTLTTLGAADGYYVYLRADGDDRVVVLLNPTDIPQKITLPLSDTPLNGHKTLEPLYGYGSATIDGNALSSTLPTNSVTMFAVR